MKNIIRKLLRESSNEKFYSRIIDSIRSGKIKPPYFKYLKNIGLERHEIGFVTSNYFDVAGAKAFGFQVIWINRNSALPDELGLPPDVELNSIEQIPEILS